MGALVCETQNIIFFLFKIKGTLEVPAVEEIFATYVWPKTTENPHFCENKMETNFDIVFLVLFWFNLSKNNPERANVFFGADHLISPLRECQ